MLFEAIVCVQRLSLSSSLCLDIPCFEYLTYRPNPTTSSHDIFNSPDDNDTTTRHILRSQTSSPLPPLRRSPTLSHLTCSLSFLDTSSLAGSRFPIASMSLTSASQYTVSLQDNHNGRGQSSDVAPRQRSHKKRRVRLRNDNPPWDEDDWVG